jgi:hypothetical protein
MVFHYVLPLTGSIRILIATIRNLGMWPCPRCQIPLNRVHNMGMARDMLQRETMARVDDMQRRHAVNAAQRVIYKKNFLVNGALVERMLQDTSLVPTAVHVHLVIAENSLNSLIFHRMHSQIHCIPLVSTFSQCCFRI